MNAREQQVRDALWRQSVFERGEIVRYVNDGISQTMLDTHEASVGPCEYVVIATRSNWMQVACLRHRGDGTEHRKFPRIEPGVGSSYFRIVGECGLHSPVWRPEGEAPPAEESRRLGRDSRLGWKCARCDVQLPEASSRFHMLPSMAKTT